MRTMAAATDSVDATGAASREPFANRPLGRIVLTVVAPILGVTLFLLGWQLFIAVFDIKPYELPTPSKIIGELRGDPAFYISAARTTLWEAFLGFLAGFAAAIVLASIVAHSRFLERMVMPIVVLVQVTPIIAYAPAFVIWFGFGLKPIVILTAIVCAIPFLVNAITGLRSVDPSLLELARSVNANRWEVYVRLRLPSALPNLFIAARVAVGLALLGAVLGEFFAGATGGLGYAIKVAQYRTLTLQLWASVYVLAILGATVIILITVIERLVLHWHASQRS